MSGYVLQVVMLHQPVIIWKDILHKRQKCTVKNVSVKCCIHVADQRCKRICRKPQSHCMYLFFVPVHLDEPPLARIVACMPKLYMHVHVYMYL